ncbi:uncharacterized protein K452DRAFT_97896 [Aplosporella prunicola CBS 121167]|uniref:DUF7923 domain-containing protein n=1 Tax=Aplosporella prunicola CBS 121167 TaxID=1176127 RepID=A0A6A6B2W6_9PEZI|nr:uncharacterized protein K452DRAFT_97896 [Aplosporella prunicola CBS 121167]KAF2137723.1 hypothetical protein K452DRAFT_97896 [Aplosporella prunicola CBS 121167]
MAENAVAELPQLCKLREALEDAYTEVGGYLGAQRSAFMDSIASLESEKAALRTEFDQLKAAKEAVETERQSLLEEYVSLRASKESLEARVLGLQDANAKLVAENKLLDIIASVLDRQPVPPTYLLTPTQDKDPFALVLIDGNSVPIRATDAPKKFYGGLLAATVLVNAMHALQPGCKIYVRVWADLASLAAASGDSFTEEEAREFARGFTAFAHCDFVDVGNGTGRAGAKVRGTYPLAILCDALPCDNPSLGACGGCGGGVASLCHYVRC